MVDGEMPGTGCAACRRQTVAGCLAPAGQELRYGPDQTVAVQLHPFKTEVCVIAQGLEVETGERVIIRDEEGEDMGVVLGPAETDEGKGIVLRRATPEDEAVEQELVEKTRRVLDLFRRQKDEFGLDMKVVDAHWRWDRKKVCFYFISEQRLDFRALHKVISSALNIRVAIKQIGVRDHARMLGGLGLCGRQFCCAGFMTELRPIALRMARQQNLFVEPAKISGVCGKLLCCLSFEEENYRQSLAEMPRIGSRVQSARGGGKVVGMDVLRRRVHVRYDDDFEQVLGIKELKFEVEANHENPAESDDGE